MSTVGLRVTAMVDITFGAKVYAIASSESIPDTNVITEFVTNNAPPGVVEMTRTTDPGTFAITSGRATHFVPVEFHITKLYGNIATSNASVDIVPSELSNYYIYVSSVVNTDGPGDRAPTPRISWLNVAGNSFEINEMIIVNNNGSITTYYVFAVDTTAYTTTSEILDFVTGGQVTNNTTFMSGVSELGEYKAFSPPLPELSILNVPNPPTITKAFTDLSDANQVGVISFMSSGYDIFIVYTNENGESGLYRYRYQNVYNLPYDLLYRNDAQNANGYDIVSGDVNTIKDLSGNMTLSTGSPVHEHEHLVGKNMIGPVGTVSNYSPMTLDNTINTKPCFNSFMKQGEFATFNTSDGNVLKKNSDNSFTIIHVCRITQTLHTWDFLTCYGRGNDSFGLVYVNSKIQPVYDSVVMTGIGVLESVVFDKNTIFICRLRRADRHCDFKVYDINTGSYIHDMSETFATPTNTHFSNALGCAFYIGCNNFMQIGGGSNESKHIHGETLLYNGYVSESHTLLALDSLVSKWGYEIIPPSLRIYINDYNTGVFTSFIVDGKERNYLTNPYTIDVDHNGLQYVTGSDFGFGANANGHFNIAGSNTQPFTIALVLNLSIHTILNSYISPVIGHLGTMNIRLGGGGCYVLPFSSSNNGIALSNVNTTNLMASDYVLLIFSYDGLTNHMTYLKGVGMDAHTSFSDVVVGPYAHTVNFKINNLNDYRLYELLVFPVYMENDPDVYPEFKKLSEDMNSAYGI